jgi:hypothetical protein
VTQRVVLVAGTGFYSAWARGSFAIGDLANFSHQTGQPQPVSAGSYGAGRYVARASQTRLRQRDAASVPLLR